MGFKSAAAKTTGIILLIVGLVLSVIGIVYQQVNCNKLQKAPAWVVIMIVIGVILLLFGALMCVGGAIISARCVKNQLEDVKDEEKTSC